MTWGINVAPRMPAARYRPSPRAPKVGTAAPRIAAVQWMWLRATITANDIAITATRAPISNSNGRNPRFSSVRIAITVTNVSNADNGMENPARRWNPSAAPRNSARSVKMATASACSQ